MENEEHAEVDERAKTFRWIGTKLEIMAGKHCGWSIQDTPYL